MKKKSETNKLTPLEPSNLTNPVTQKPFPLELSAADWAGFGRKLDEALNDITDDLLLSSSERERFERNFELIRRVKTAEEVRNYAMLEIHEAKQWRADYRNVVELAKAFGLSKSQFYKAIKSAEINIQMAQAGLYHLKPKGRHVELLGKFDREHRVAAWSFALVAAGEKGESTKVIDRALDDFLDRLKGNSDSGRRKAELRLPILRVEAEDEGSENHNRIDFSWIADLDEIEEKVFQHLISMETWFGTLKDPAMSHGSTMANLLTSLALNFITRTDDVCKMRNAIRLTVSKDPRLRRGFYHLGLYLIVEFLNQSYRRKYPRQF